MKLLEYEAKILLRQSGVSIPASQVFHSPAETLQLPLPVVLKVQIPVGGRGKAGGIRQVQSVEDLHHQASELFTTPILGHVTSQLLVEEQLQINQELYLSLAIDRASQRVVLLAHPSGGIDIEDAAMNDTSLLKMPLTSSPNKHTTAKLMAHYSLSPNLEPQLHALLLSLWDAFITNEALLLEINPLIVTKQKNLICADAKMELDDAALFRHPEWKFEQQIVQSQFVILNQNGTIASMANGAGLAMATVDAISDSGGHPANFLDIGGGTNTEGMVSTFGTIAAMPSVRAIVVNVFAGITRCDEVAEAIVTAKQRFNKLPPLFIRLSGTNEKVGKEILQKNGVVTLSTLQECVKSAVQEAAHV